MLRARTRAKPDCPIGRDHPRRATRWSDNALSRLNALPERLAHWRHHLERAIVGERTLRQNVVGSPEESGREGGQLCQRNGDGAIGEIGISFESSISDIRQAAYYMRGEARCGFEGIMGQSNTNTVQ
jgi:hypothetical protein